MMAGKSEEEEGEEEFGNLLEDEAREVCEDDVEYLEDEEEAEWWRQEGLGQQARGGG